MLLACLFSTIDDQFISMYLIQVTSLDSCVEVLSCDEVLVLLYCKTDSDSCQFMSSLQHLMVYSSLSLSD